MAYVYLLDLYKFLDERIMEASEAVNDAEKETSEGMFHQGRLLSLSSFRDFLIRNLNPRLPRKIREHHKLP